MQREVTLEEYFTLKPEDRLEFKQQVTGNIWQWEPSVRTNIEKVIELGLKPKHKDGPEVASGLLAHVKSLELTQALRRHFKDAHKHDWHFDAIAILLDAILECPYMTFEQRFELVKYYTANPRYPRSERVDRALSDCLFHLSADLLDWGDEISALQTKIKSNN